MHENRLVTLMMQPTIHFSFIPRLILSLLHFHVILRTGKSELFLIDLFLGKVGWMDSEILLPSRGSVYAETIEGMKARGRLLRILSTRVALSAQIGIPSPNNPPQLFPIFHISVTPPAIPLRDSVGSLAQIKNLFDFNLIYRFCSLCWH